MHKKRPETNAWVDGKKELGEHFKRARTGPSSLVCLYPKYIGRYQESLKASTTDVPNDSELKLSCYGPPSGEMDAARIKPKREQMKACK